MIENQDTPTLPRLPSVAESAETTSATSQTESPTVQATVIPAHAFMSVDDLLELKLAGDPQISPDGSRIAFTVLTCHRQTNRTSSAIWLVQHTGEHVRQVTSGEQHDFAPRWSPDGTTLAFLSDRRDTAQLYLLPLHAGEARQISTFPHGISEYSWRPDGQALLAHSPWKPADDTNEPDQSAIAVVYTRLDEQWDGSGYKQGRHQQLWLLPLESEPVRLTSEPVDLLQSCWSPDGSEIAFCANRRPDPDRSASMALWVLTLATGQMRRLTPEEGLAQMPSWSPDGQSIAYHYSADQTEASNITPWIVKANGNEAPRPATTQTPDVTCLEFIVDELHGGESTRPQWYPDGQSLLISVQERGQVHLYRADTVHDQLHPLTSGNGCYLSPQLSTHGETIALVRTDWFTPGDIWSMDSNGQNRHKLTGVNDAFLRSRQLIRPKRMTWQSSDGLQIEGWLYLAPLPPGTKAPLILEVHGGPTLAWGDSYVHEFQVLAGQGFAVLAANPRGSSGYGEDFCRKVLNDWGGADFGDLMAGLDAVSTTEPIDSQRLGIAGLSYGGYMSNWAITQTNRFKAAVSRNGISDLTTASNLSDQTIWFDLGLGGGEDSPTFRQNRSPLSHAERISTPLLLLHGENDLRCPLSESQQLFVQLRKRKQVVEFVRYPGLSHQFDWPALGSPLQRLDRLRRTLDWFTRYV